MKQGFVIARDSQRAQFFTSRSSYQHPDWTPLAEGTVYHTFETANAAVKKMWLSGNLTARVVPLSEMEMQVELPKPDDQEHVMSSDDNSDDQGQVCDMCKKSQDDCECDDNQSDGPCPVCGDGPCQCEPEDGKKVVVVVAHDPMAVDRTRMGEGQIDEVSVKKIDSYLAGAKVEDQEALTRGKDSKDRSEGVALALKKKWGNKEFCLTEPKVKATEVKEDDGEAFSRARFLPSQKVKHNDDKSKSYYVVADDGTGNVQIRQCGDEESEPMTVNSSTLVKEQFTLLPKEEHGSVKDHDAKAAVSRDQERKWQKDRSENPGRWVVKDAKGKQYGNPMSKEGAHTFAKNNLAARLAGARAVMFEDVFKMPAKPPLDGKDTDNTQLIPNLKIKVDDLKLDDPTVVDQKDPDTKLTHATAEQNVDAVKVPGEVKSKLSAAIATFKKCSDFNNGRDDAQAQFCMTCHAALEELQDLLNQGTVEAIKMAQVKMTSWMNPITTNIPPEVRDFVLRGGMKPSIKDLFDVKKGQQMIDKVSKGLNQK